MASLDNLITKINNVIQNDLKTSVSGVGNSSVFFAGSAAGIYQKYLSSIVKGEVLNTRDVDRLLTLNSIKDQVEILKEGATSVETIRQEMQALINSKAVYLSLQTARTIEPDRISAYSVEVAEHNYNEKLNSVNNQINNLRNKLTKILSKALPQIGRSNEESDGYYIDVNSLIVHIGGLLGTINPELDRVAAEINSLNIVDFIEVNAVVDTTPYLGSPYRQVTRTITITKTLGCITARNRLLNNIERMKTYVDRVSQRLENHLTRILEFENGKEVDETFNAVPISDSDSYTDGESLERGDNTVNPGQIANSDETNNSNTYTIKPGDTLSSIASNYGISWQDLYEANKDKIGSNPNLIHSGVMLTIPSIAMAAVPSQDSGDALSTPTQTNSNSTGSSSNGNSASAATTQTNSSSSNSSNGGSSASVQEPSTTTHEATTESSEEKPSTISSDSIPSIFDNDSETLPEDWKSPLPNEYPENQRVVYNTLKEAGYNDAAIAGIMGNITQECHWDPKSYNASEDGGGFCGWKYKYFEGARGLETAQENVDYLIYTLDHPEHAQQKGVKEALLNVPDTPEGAVQAANIFIGYEDCSGGTDDLRINYAKDFYASF